MVILVVVRFGRGNHWYFALWSQKYKMKRHEMKLESNTTQHTFVSISSPLSDPSKCSKQHTSLSFPLFSFLLVSFALVVVFLVCLSHDNTKKTKSVTQCCLFAFCLHVFSVLAVLVPISDDVVFCASQQHSKRNRVVLCFFLERNKQTNLQQFNDFGVSFSFYDVNWRCSILLIVFWFVLLCVVFFWQKLNSDNSFRFFVVICGKFKNHIKTVHELGAIFFNLLLNCKYFCLVETVITSGPHTHTHTPYLSCFPQQQLFFLFVTEEKLLCCVVLCCTMWENLSFFEPFAQFLEIGGCFCFCFCFDFWDNLWQCFCSQKAIHPISKKERNSNTPKKNQKRDNTMYFFFALSLVWKPFPLNLTKKAHIFFGFFVHFVIFCVFFLFSSHSCFLFFVMFLCLFSLQEQEFCGKYHFGVVVTLFSWQFTLMLFPKVPL